MDTDTEDTKHAGGRPLLFETVEDLQKNIQAYFDDCLPHPEEVTVYEWKQKTVTRKVHGVAKDFKEDDHSQPPLRRKEWRISAAKTPSITSLAVFLKTSRETLINYQLRTEFFDTIKEAKDIIESEWESMLRGSNVTGVIFNLKNNYKWQDKTENEITNPDGSLNPYSKLSEDELRKLAKG